MDRSDGLIATTLLAAASGARVMTGVSATTHVLDRSQLIDGRVAAVTKMWAAGELVGDKLPNIPDRNQGASLVGRVVAGALIGAAIGTAAKRDRQTMAIVGGLVAFLSAHATYRARRRLSEHLPAIAAAIVEDAAIVSVASIGAALLDGALAVRDAEAPTA